MTTTPSADGAPDSILMTVLERWFDAQDRGEPLPLVDLCGGDAELCARAQKIVDGQAVTREIMVAMGAFARVASRPEVPVERIGEYTIVAPLGQGGMGRVYLAEQPSVGRMVALKVLSSESSAGDRSRFLREGRLAASIDHPNVVPIYAVGEDRDHPYIAMKWLSGPGLDQLTEPLDPRTAARITATVARALHEAHLAGVIHRDVKPGNVILDNEKPYLVDFGLARAAADVSLTMKGAVPGTLLYLAPELLGSTRRPPDPRIDIYGLGATLYEVLAGRPCFDLEEPERLVREILDRDPPPIALPSAHRDLETIVFRALSKEPERRFASAADFAGDLERYLEGEPILSRPMSPVSRLWRLGKRHRQVTALVAAALLVSAGSGLFHLNRRARENEGIRQGLQALQRHITARELAAATDALDILRSTYGDRTQFDETRMRIASAQALEDLLDLVQQVPDAVDLNRLRETSERVDATFSHSDAPDTAHLALTLAALNLGEAAEARRRLAALEDQPGRRAVKALRAAIDGERSVDLGDPGPASADDHIFASLALGLGIVDLAAAEAEAELALQKDEGGFRAKWARVSTLVRRRDFEGALHMLTGLVRRGSPNDEIRRAMAYALLALGRSGEAIAQLRKVSVHTPKDLAALARAHWLAGEQDVVEALLQEAERERHWGAETEILLFRGFLAQRKGDWTAAITAFEKAAGGARSRAKLDLANAELLHSRVLALQQEAQASGATSEVTADAWIELEEEADALALAFRSQEARSVTSMARAIIAEARGKATAACRHYAEALAGNPNNVPAALRFGVLALNSVIQQQLAVASPEAVAARRHLDQIARSPVRHVQMMSPKARVEICRLAALFAHLAGDEDELRLHMAGCQEACRAAGIDFGEIERQVSEIRARLGAR
jgi:serine/threonine protein kinase/tetratricopeptide (TPR) repeat protein